MLCTFTSGQRAAGPRAAFVLPSGPRAHSWHPGRGAAPPCGPVARMQPGRSGPEERLGKLAVATPWWPHRIPECGQLGPETESPPLRFGHAWGAQMPRLGAVGPLTPLPHSTFGPRHQHKEGSGRKGRVVGPHPGRGEDILEQIAALRSTPRESQGCKPPPLQGLQPQPLCTLSSSLLAAPGLGTQARACTGPCHLGWLGRAGPGGAEPPGPDLGRLHPPRRKHSKHRTLKARSTSGKPCSRFTGRETEATGTSARSPWGI